MKTNSREKIKAELLSNYMDQLSAGTAPSPDEFVAAHGEMGQEIRDLIEPALPLRNSRAFPSLPRERKEAAFARLQAELRGTASSTPESAPITQRTDILILMFQLAGEIWGNVKLIKLPFLLGAEGGCGSFVPDFYGHEAYNYGAFDKKILSDVDSLVQMGIIDKQTPAATTSRDEELDVPSAEKKVHAIYKLTPRGEKIAELLARGARAQDPKILESIQKVMRQHGDKTGEELIAYTYDKYPDTAVNSKVRDKYLKPARRKKSDNSGGTNNAA